MAQLYLGDTQNRSTPTKIPKSEFPFNMICTKNNLNLLYCVENSLSNLIKDGDENIELISVSKIDAAIQNGVQSGYRELIHFINRDFGSVSCINGNFLNVFNYSYYYYYHHFLQLFLFSILFLPKFCGLWNPLKKQPDHFQTDVVLHTKSGVNIKAIREIYQKLWNLRNPQVTAAINHSVEKILKEVEKGMYSRDDDIVLLCCCVVVLFCGKFSF